MDGRILTSLFAAATLVLGASATNYTWSGAGDGENWEDPANWLNGSTPVTAGYPGINSKGAASTGDTAAFPSGTHAVTLSRKIQFASLNLTTAGTALTLHGGEAGTNNFLTIGTAINLGADNVLTLDRFGLFISKDVTTGARSALSLVNGAYLRTNKFTPGQGGSFSMSDGSYCYMYGALNVANEGCSVSLSDGAYLLVENTATIAGEGELTLSGGACLKMKLGTFTAYQAKSLSISGRSTLDVAALSFCGVGREVTIDDSTVLSRGNCLLGKTAPGGGVIRFKGANPVLEVRGSNFRTDYNNAAMTAPVEFLFTVPRGGFASVPFLHTADTTTTTFSGNANCKAMAKFAVDPDSPALKAGTQTQTQLALSRPGFYAIASSGRFVALDGSVAGATLRLAAGDGVAVPTTDATTKGVWADVGLGAAEPSAAEKSAIASQSYFAISRKTVNGTAFVTSRSGVAARTELRLLVGDSEDDMTCVATATVPRTGTYGLSWTAPEGCFEQVYSVRLDLVDLGAGDGVLATSSTPVKSVRTLDTTTYTWTNASGDGMWSNPENWSDNQSGNCLGYPYTSGATAKFAGDADVELDVNCTIAWLDLSAKNADIRFHSSNTNDFRLTANNRTIPGTGTRWTLDCAAVYCAFDFTWSADSSLVLTNGANLFISKCALTSARVSVGLYGDSWLRTSTLSIGADGIICINDSTLYTTDTDYIGYDAKGATVRFEGRHPLLYHYGTAGYLCANNAGSTPHLDFLVPLGGYDAPPLVARGTPSYLMGVAKTAANQAVIRVNVLPDSPAARFNGSTDTELISWAKGIDTALVVGGDLPTEAPGSVFRWSEDLAGGYPKGLAATVVGSGHADRLTVSGFPEAFAADKVDYGNHDGLVAGVSVLECVAPDGYQAVSGTKRVICTGWKLYSVDSVTHLRTPVDEGSGTYTHLHGGAWMELEWQWDVEYLVSTAVSGNGRVEPAEVWTKEGCTASLTAVADAGHGFLKWTGLSPDADKRANPACVTVLSETNLTAVFITGETDPSKIPFDSVTVQGAKTGMPLNLTNIWCQTDLNGIPVNYSAVGWDLDEVESGRTVSLLLSMEGSTEQIVVASGLTGRDVCIWEPTDLNRAAYVLQHQVMKGATGVPSETLKAVFSFENVMMRATDAEILAAVTASVSQPFGFVNNGGDEEVRWEPIGGKGEGIEAAVAGGAPMTLEFSIDGIGSLAFDWRAIGATLTVSLDGRVLDLPAGSADWSGMTVSTDVQGRHVVEVIAQSASSGTAGVKGVRWITDDLVYCTANSSDGVRVDLREGIRAVAQREDLLPFVYSHTNFVGLAGTTAESVARVSIVRLAPDEPTDDVTLWTNAVAGTERVMRAESDESSVRWRGHGGVWKAVFDIVTGEDTVHTETAIFDMRAFHPGFMLMLK